MDCAISRTEVVYWMAAAALMAMFAAVVGLQFVDKRVIAGESIWLKPMKFQLALALHFATLALATGILGAERRASTLLLSVAIAAVASAAFEIGYIMVQAVRQQASHFNVSTPFHAAMYSLMAAGAVVITAASGAVGIAAWSDQHSGLSATLRNAVGLGLTGGTVLTLMVAFRMGAALDHHVGIENANASRLPLLGWSRTVGDLRVPHFLATHMMQTIPLAGLAIDRVASGPAAVALVWAVAIAWVALTIFAFQRAISGQPFV